MDSIEALRLIELDASHVADGVALSSEARWNQVAADWSLMLEQGSAIGYQAADGSIVASALILPYGGQFAWISMVLVTAAWQRRGLATRLLQQCLSRLEARGMAQILDATPAGAQVYGPLGFAPQFDMLRWETQSVSADLPELRHSRAYRADDFDAVVAYDRAVFGADRSGILAGLASRCRGFARIATAGQGYLFGRDGRRATQIGPICADTSDTAIDLLSGALAQFSGPVFIDVPDRHAAVSTFLQARGFAVQRPFKRMFRGSPDGFGDPSRMFAVAGPELG